MLPALSLAPIVHLYPNTAEPCSTGERRRKGTQRLTPGYHSNTSQLRLLSGRYGRCLVSLPAPPPSVTLPCGQSPRAGGDSQQTVAESSPRVSVSAVTCRATKLRLRGGFPSPAPPPPNGAMLTEVLVPCPTPLPICRGTLEPSAARALPGPPHRIRTTPCGKPTARDGNGRSPAGAARSQPRSPTRFLEPLSVPVPPVPVPTPACSGARDQDQGREVLARGRRAAAGGRWLRRR